MSELLPCPFCGGEAGPTVKPYIGCNGSGFTVDCEKCWASTGYYDSYEEAVAAWNTRAERTCKREIDGLHWYRCGECHHKPLNLNDNYCPSCGAKVVEP